MALSSQELEPPPNPGRFISALDLLLIDDTDRIFYQPIVADALLSLLQQREDRGRRTLLTVTMNDAPQVQHALIDYLDNQPATRLR